VLRRKAGVWLNRILMIVCDRTKSYGANYEFVGVLVYSVGRVVGGG
jgi:hypothetical protein